MSYCYHMLWRKSFPCRHVMISRTHLLGFVTCLELVHGVFFSLFLFLVTLSGTHMKDEIVPMTGDIHAVSFLICVIFTSLPLSACSDTSPQGLYGGLFSVSPPCCFSLSLSFPQIFTCSTKKMIYIRSDILLCNLADDFICRSISAIV